MILDYWANDKNPLHSLKVLIIATTRFQVWVILLIKKHQAKLEYCVDLFFVLVVGVEADLHCVEYMVNVDPEEPSWWVWVTEEMVPSNTEEWSGIDNENYVIISEEQVVDGVANFLAQCVLSSPKSKVLIFYF